LIPAFFFSFPFSVYFTTTRVHVPSNASLPTTTGRKIIPLGIGNYNAQVQALNAAIGPWAQGLNKTDSPIWVVDQYTGFTSADLRDGVHPNDKGDEKMVGVWYPAVVRAFEAVRAERVTGVGFVA
jgi:hypothetical protein